MHVQIALKRVFDGLDHFQRRVVEIPSVLPAGAGIDELVAISGMVAGGRARVVSAAAELFRAGVVRCRAYGEGAHYELPPVVRMHVLGVLEAGSDLLDLRKSALRHHLEVVEGATEALLSGSHQRRLLDQIAEHYPNFRSSLAFALEEQDFVSAARLAEGLWRFWELRGMLAEGRSWLERCLKGGPLPPELRVRLLDGAGMLAWRQGDFSDATRYFGEALACCGASNPTIPMRGRLHNHAGLVELFSGNLAAAISDFEVALAEPEAAQCPGEAAAVRANLALAAIERGRLFEAMRLAEEALAVQVAGGDRHGQAVCLLHRAIALYYSGEPSSAAGEARVAAGIFEELGDNRNLSFCLLLLAGCLAETHPGLAV